VVFTEERNELMEKYRILKCTDEQLSLIDKEDIIGMRKGRFASEVLTNAADKYPDIAADVPNIDEIMVYFISKDGE
jgi:ABC-2 type transport system ATP-binding protein